MELRSCCVQKLVWKFKNRISKILLFLMFMEIMCIQVHAAELELEPKTYSDSNPYNFKFSYTWTSEGKTIQSYDVSENGQIAIAFSDNTIGVFDKYEFYVPAVIFVQWRIRRAMAGRKSSVY